MAGRLAADHVWRGLGSAARAIGDQVHAYRPADLGEALRPGNRFLRLPAFFTPPRSGAQGSNGYGDVGWEGGFDAAYTRPGDYLVREDGAIWFIAVQVPLAPTLCVRARRSLSFSRPSGPVAAGANLYGGVVRSTAAEVLTKWPAAMVITGTSGAGALARSGEMPQVNWSVLLPPIAWVRVLPGDIMADDLGRAGVVETCEFGEMGWRLQIHQATA